MKILLALVERNIKLFFRDKGMFFTSLITPVILLVLYASFLGNVFRDSFVQNLPQGFPLEEAILDGLVGGQLISSILAVSCVTVSFSASHCVYDITEVRGVRISWERVRMSCSFSWFRARSLAFTSRWAADR